MKRCFYSMMAAMALLLLSACSSDDELSQGNGNEAGLLQRRAVRRYAEQGD